ncbi:MAG: c-type cytochrome [Planctomycetaceae bacterium]
MPDFLRQIRDEATATLSTAEREVLGDLLQPGSQNEPAALTVERPFVRKWTLDELTDEITGTSHQPDTEHGRRLFSEALCLSCHRMNGSGAVVGPDLTSVANRFGRRDLLTSIVSPSSVVAEKYRNMQVVTTSGKVISGRILTGGDYRSTTLRIATDPLRPSQLVEITKAEIESYEPSQTSPMPEGLLNTLSARDVMDLLAFLQSAGR